jgi:hypothetical protein
MDNYDDILDNLASAIEIEKNRLPEYHHASGVVDLDPKVDHNIFRDPKTDDFFRRSYDFHDSNPEIKIDPEIELSSEKPYTHSEIDDYFAEAREINKSELAKTLKHEYGGIDCREDRIRDDDQVSTIAKSGVRRRITANDIYGRSKRQDILKVTPDQKTLYDCKDTFNQYVQEGGDAVLPEKIHKELVSIRSRDQLNEKDSNELELLLSRIEDYETKEFADSYQNADSAFSRYIKRTTVRVAGLATVALLGIAAIMGPNDYSSKGSVPNRILVPLSHSIVQENKIGVDVLEKSGISVPTLNENLESVVSDPSTLDTFDALNKGNEINYNHQVRESINNLAVLAQSVFDMGESESVNVDSPSKIIEYVVKPGDTPGRVARKMTGDWKKWSEIASYNKILRKDGKGVTQFRPGDVLQINLGESQTHTVSRGEGLRSMARKYCDDSSKYKDFAKRNNLLRNDGTIKVYHPGDTMIIPESCRTENSDLREDMKKGLLGKLRSNISNLFRG